MKKCLVRNNFLNDDFLDLLGFNLLEGLKPVVFEDNGAVFEGIKYNGELYDDAFKIITKPITNIKDLDYIEIPLTSCTLLYDLGKIMKIDRVYISSYFDDYNDYTLGVYELYLSDNLDSIFLRENKILSYSNEELYEPLPTRNHADQIFDLSDYKGRYFAIKVIKPNFTDDIIKIANIALYSHNISEQYMFCNKNFEESIISEHILFAYIMRI